MYKNIAFIPQEGLVILKRTLLPFK